MQEYILTSSTNEICNINERCICLPSFQMMMMLMRKARLQREPLIGFNSLAFCFFILRWKMKKLHTWKSWKKNPPQKKKPLDSNTDGIRFPFIESRWFSKRISSRRECVRHIKDMLAVIHQKKQLSESISSLPLHRASPPPCSLNQQHEIISVQIKNNQAKASLSCVV